MLFIENRGELRRNGRRVEIKVKASPEENNSTLSVIIAERLVILESIVTNEKRIKETWSKIIRIMMIMYQFLFWWYLWSWWKYGKFVLCETSGVIDYGASQHVTSRKEFFTSYTILEFLRWVMMVYRRLSALVMFV